MLIDGARLVLHRRLGETIPKICSSRKVAYLRKPVEQHADWTYDLGPIRRIEEDEKHLGGEPLDPETVVLSSQHRPPPGKREVVAVVNCRRFQQFAPHVQWLVNLAWRGLKQGRTLRSISLDNGYNLFLLSSSEDSTDLAKMEKCVSDVLQQTELGYVTGDQYEVDRLKSMLDLRDTVGSEAA